VTRPDLILEPFDQRAADALHPVLETGRLGRFRMLDVACPSPRGHRLVEVIRTAEGPVVRGVGPRIRKYEIRDGGTTHDPETGSPVDWEYTSERTSRANRGEHVCRFLSDAVYTYHVLGKPMLTGGVAHADTPVTHSSCLRVQCRCRTADIWGVWLQGQIDAGHRRVVYDGELGLDRIG
jgi:hypothetical protein